LPTLPPFTLVSPSVLSKLPLKGIRTSIDPQASM
jgi:hypothetical protein